MLIVDSNEKWTQPGNRDRHLRDYFERHNIMWRRERLNVGDYMLDGGCISVDRKYGLEEICKNMTNREDNKRFMAEVRRAYEAGIKLVILVEQRGIICHNDIARWRSAYTGVSGAFLLKRMYQLEISYHVRFVFCDRRSCGRRIMEILTTGR